MKNPVLKYGLYGAITICLLFLISWFLLTDLSYAFQEVFGYLAMVISLTFVFFGIKYFRDEQNQGKVTFKKALIVGVLISLITALAFGILDVIYTEILNPDFMANYYQSAAEKLRNTLTGDQLEARLAELETQRAMFANPLVSFTLMAATVFVIGFIISLISALILQRK